MKQRVRVDVTLLIFFILLASGFYLFPQSYFGQRCVDNVLDFLGVTFILKGTFCAKRTIGHKRSVHISAQSDVCGKFSARVRIRFGHLSLVVLADLYGRFLSAI